MKVARQQALFKRRQTMAQHGVPFCAKARALTLALIRRIQRWHRLSYERRLLASLDQHQLRDIGISRAEAQRESARPFWDDAGVDAPRRDI